jgi:hypothetical protein
MKTTSRGSCTRKGIAATALLASALCGLGCGAKPQKSGEVFLVMASGENQKLGLVEVVTVAPERITDTMTTRIAEALRTLQRAEKAVAVEVNARKRSAESMQADAEARHKAVANERDLVRKAASLSASASRASQNADSVLEQMKRQAALKAARDASHTQFEEAWAEISTVRRESAKTDSSGMFSIPYLFGDWICAYTTRTIDGEVRHLVWLLRPAEIKGASKLLLSNDNCVVDASE